MGFSSKIREKFIDEVDIPPSDLLDEVVDWIRNSLEPDEVFDNHQLEDWAFEKGFKKFE